MSKAIRVAHTALVYFAAAVVAAPGGRWRRTCPPPPWRWVKPWARDRGETIPDNWDRLAETAARLDEPMPATLG